MGDASSTTSRARGRRGSRAVLVARDGAAGAVPAGVPVVRDLRGVRSSRPVPLGLKHERAAALLRPSGPPPEPPERPEGARDARAPRRRCRRGAGGSALVALIVGARDPARARRRRGDHRRDRGRRRGRPAVRRASSRSRSCRTSASSSRRIFVGPRGPRPDGARVRPRPHAAVAARRASSRASTSPSTCSPAIWSQVLNIKRGDDLPDELGADHSTAALVAVLVLVVRHGADLRGVLLPRAASSRRCACRSACCRPRSSPALVFGIDPRRLVARRAARAARGARLRACASSTRGRDRSIRASRCTPSTTRSRSA